MSQGGANSTKGSGGDPLETLDGNSGGAVGPDSSFNIDLLGNNATGINIVGTPASNLLTVIGIASSETQVGTIELATPAETTTGTSTTLAVHPSGLNTKLGAQTANGLIYGSGGAGTNLAALGEATDGQLPLGDTGGPPVLATISASDSLLTLTGGAGSLDIVAQNAVSAAATLTDNAVARGDGGVRGIKTSWMSINNDGQATNGMQSAFLAYQATTAANVTGDGSLYILGTTIDLTEVFDQNSDFDPTTGIFTAPITGRYFLSANAHVVGMLALTQYTIIITTTNRTFFGRIDPGAAAECSQCSMPISILADMDAGDISGVTISTFDTGGKVDNIFGNSQIWTFFSGNLQT